MFSSFNCIEVDERIGKRLYDDLNAVCWDEKHSLLVGFISMPTLAFVIFGCPLYLVYILS